MNSRRIIPIIIIFSFFQLPQNADAQYDNKILHSYFKEMKNCNKVMNEKVVENRNHGVELNYSIAVIPKTSESQNPITNRIKLLAQGENSFYYSEFIEVFQDASTSVRVIPKRKEIRIYDYRAQEKDLYLLKKYEVLNDSMFNSASPVAYENLNNGRKSISLHFTESWTSKFKILRANVIFDTQTQTIVELEVFYSSESKYRYMKISIDDIKYGSKARVPNSTAISMVYKNNSLQNNYAGYQIIDNRSKPSL